MPLVGLPASMTVMPSYSYFILYLKKLLEQVAAEEAKKDRPVWTVFYTGSFTALLRR